MKSSAFIFRYTHILVGIVLVGIFSLGGCGGGDDGEPVDVPGTVPDVLNYEMKQTTGVNLVIDQASVGQVTVSSTLLTGGYNRITNDFTLVPFGPAMLVDAASFLDGLYGTQFNQYVLQVNETLSWTGDNPATYGEFDIRDQSVQQALIRVTITATGVDLAYFLNGDPNDPPSASSTLTWEELDDVFANSAAEDYQQIAAFAHNVLHFMYEQGGLVIQALELISENDVQLEETGTVEQNCDSYPLPTSPPVSYDPGLIRVNWYDADNSIDLGPGDTVYLSFFECWDNDESDIFDTLYDGGVDLVNYTEVESAGIVTRIGFEPSATGPGGINYDYLDITETETTASNVLVNTSEAITLSGGFSLVFTSP